MVTRGLEIGAGKRVIGDRTTDATGRSVIASNDDALSEPRIHDGSVTPADDAMTRFSDVRKLEAMQVKTLHDAYDAFLRFTRGFRGDDAMTRFLHYQLVTRERALGRHMQSRVIASLTAVRS